MDALVSKIITAVILFIITIILSFIPYFMVLRGSSSIVSARRRNGIIAYLNCLAGGVFMGTLLVYILTEGFEEFEKYKKTAGLETEFPLFNLFVAGGFFLVASVELFVHAKLHHHQPEVYSGCGGGHSTMTSVHGAVGEVVHQYLTFCIDYYCSINR
ncbi:hypothetical protein EGW08_000448 [Elysia chlorotica]|uniref:Uncharacterized protein n=1 Tax=Elysia chlorotica TaxID=188477 RepID=A0A433UDC5_ELYCH|nr:hypothetical protein EGW08_000448 [Elysia chlorotica]